SAAARMTWEEAMARIIHTLDPKRKLPENVEELPGIYNTVLTGRRTLLLFDNVAEKAQVIPLMPPAGNGVLITSRRILDIPGLAQRSLDTLPPDEGVSLLRALAGRVSAEDAAAIGTECGWLPLAIRLAGGTLARRPDLPPGRYLERLRNAKLRELDAVAASIRLSEGQLPRPLRRRWRELAVLVGW